MKIAVSREAMQSIDKYTCDNLVPSRELMKRAGLAVVEHIKHLEGSFAVVCGRGNNAGDGYVIAAELFKYTFRTDRLAVGINLYHMQYRDQLVPTGMVNEGSDALNVNVPDSYRRGVELTAAWEAAKWLTVSGNATLSENKIEDYIDALADSPTYGQNLGSMTIAYSPSAMGSVAIDLHHKGFSALFNTRFVGKQYFTNNEVEALSLDSYTVTDLHLGYRLKTQAKGEVIFGLQLNNLVNRLYSSNGYGYSYMWDGERYDEAFYFPQAPFHVLGNITVKF